MTFTDWIRGVRTVARDTGPTVAAKWGATELVQGGLRRIAGGRVNYGTPAWDRGDWDVLIVLDACRFDLMQEVTAGYAWFPAPSKHYSPASMSSEWLVQMSAPRYAREMEQDGARLGECLHQRPCRRGRVEHG